MKHEHFTAIRRRLGKLEAIARDCDATDAKIRQAAESRRGQIQDELARCARRVHLDPAAGNRYLELIDERRHLDRVLGTA